MNNKTLLSFSTHLLSGMLGALAILALVINNTPDIHHTLDKETADLATNDSLSIAANCNVLIKLQEKLNTAFKGHSEEAVQFTLSDEHCKNLVHIVNDSSAYNITRPDTLSLSN
jgi:hypothetical protein